MLTAERLRELLRYDAETGVFRWRPRGRGIRAGKIAGGHCQGYIRIRTGKHCYAAHQLAWLYVHGIWPSAEIDHINGIGSDNRIANLRVATRSQNCQNASVRKDNTSGYKGVYKFEGRYRARIMLDKRPIFLGVFDTAEEAYAAYCRASADLHGDFGRTQ